MEVTSYKKLKGNIYRVLIDDGREYKLFDDVILKYELLIDKNLDQKKLDEVLKAHFELEAYYKAVKYIGLKMRTELEIRKYLQQQEIPSHVIEETVVKLRAGGYLDEQRYTEAYINDSLNLGMNGPLKIRDSLKRRGIKDEYIDQYLDSISCETWRSRIESILNKKSKTNKTGLAVFKNKVFSQLYLLGYYQEDIKYVLDGFSLDTTDVFIKEADKIYDKLAIKYEGNELKMRFNSKMYLKGFESEKIKEYLQNKSYTN